MQLLAVDEATSTWVADPVICPCPDGGLGFFSEDNSILHFDSIECELHSGLSALLLVASCDCVQLASDIAKIKGEGSHC